MFNKVDSRRRTEGIDFVEHPGGACGADQKRAWNTYLCLGYVLFMECIQQSVCRGIDLVKCLFGSGIFKWFCLSMYKDRNVSS
jgi:hypothetical protein